MRSDRSRWSGSIVASALAVALGSAACGSDSDTSSDADTAESVAVPAETREAGDGVEASSENPIVLGYKISGPAGTVVKANTVAMVDGVAQQDFDQTWQLTDGPRSMLFTAFVDEAVITLEVTEGGPAMVVGFRGNFVDPENPFLGHVVAEELGSAELPAGEITMFELP
jgi:hypothetical protein